MDKDQEFKDIFETFEQVMNSFMLLEKKPRDYGTGVILYSSEIHTIECIGRNPGSNVTEIAKLMCVTKGAVSQIINRLEKKNYVCKYRDKENEKEVLLRLVDLGEKAYSGHEVFHTKYYDNLKMLLRHRSEEEIKMLRMSFRRILQYTNKYF